MVGKRRLGATALAVALVTGGFVAAAPHASAAACTSSTDQPEISEVMVSQGIPSYGKLIRGKKTLIKLFLTTPSTCTTTSKMYPPDAQLKLTRIGPNGPIDGGTSFSQSPTSPPSGGPLVATQ